MEESELEQWSHRDFTQIKERRPEGAGVDWELEEEASAFSFLWPERLVAKEEEEEDRDGEAGAFEFMEMEAEQPGSVSSPADELFFKGKLLPLHLPPRIQMVKKLQQVGVRKVETQTRFARVVKETARAWWDPRELGARDCSTSGCDSSGDSSSSRDSNGSSQDCFDGAGAKLDGQYKGFFHNREVFSAQSCSSAHPAASGTSGISTWLRPPFKWKVLFGAKKSPSSSLEQPRALSMEAESTFSRADRYYSDCSGELTQSGDLLLSSRGGRGMERAKGYLMRALNLNRSSSKDHPAAPGRAAAITTTSKSFPPFSQSFRFSPKDHILKRPPPPPSSSPPTPRVSTSSPSVEPHCDIKGAIAHCKESQNT